MEENFQLEKEKYIKNTNNKKETTIKHLLFLFLLSTLKILTKKELIFLCE